MRIPNEQASKKLDRVECQLGDGHPLHFVLKVEKHGTLGAARWPGAEMDWKRMSSIGFRWVICACSEDPDYDPFPLKFLARIGLTDLSAKGQPDNPGAEFEQIAAIASQAFSKLNEGGILVHCAGGRGRTGTILGAILRHCGYSAAEVINFWTPPIARPDGQVGRKAGGNRKSSNESGRPPKRGLAQARCLTLWRLSGCASDGALPAGEDSSWPKSESDAQVCCLMPPFETRLDFENWRNV
jgi:Tyrosine phosphatase family